MRGRQRDSTGIGEVISEVERNAAVMNVEMAELALRLSDLRCDGNQMFAMRNYEEAIERYTRCIEGSSEGLNSSTRVTTVNSSGGDDAEERNEGQNYISEMEKTLALAYSNRAECNLRLGNFFGTVADAERALELDPDNVKSLNRRGKALEALEQFEKAHASFAAAHEKAPRDLDIAKAVKRTKSCVQQSLYGDYILSEFYLNGCKGDLNPCCNYVGPVQIAKVKDAGRGLILTKDVLAGELLFVSNALATAFVMPEPSLLHQGLHYQCENEDEHLISKLTEVAKTSTRARLQLYSLAFENSQLDMEIPSMDLFRPGCEWIQSITSEEQAETEVDVVRIWGVAHYSALNLYGHTADISEYFDSERARRRGLWPLAAFMNHACFPNCLRMHIGNAMFVRAARHIPAGEELTINYFGVLDSIETRQESAKQWGFLCGCERCVFEQGIGPLERLGRKFSELICVRPSWQEEDEAVSKPQVSQKDLNILYNGAEDIINSRVNLRPEQKHWIVASCIYAYVGQVATQKNNPKWRVRILRVLVDCITSVSAANVWGLEYACDLLREVGRLHGRSSEEYVKTEERVIDIFRTAYGVQSSRNALERLIQVFHEADGSVHSCDRC